MIESVKKYNSIGISCLPCLPDKRPAVVSPDTWLREFNITEFENAKAIGIKCGKVSGNLECLDIDNHNNTAKENLASFIEQIKPLYEKYKFPIEQTQNGGYHLIYRCESIIEGNLKLAQVPVNKSGKWKPDTIFETRGDGGYFLCYPSPGYTVVRNDIFIIPTITKEDRNTIIEVAKTFQTWYELKKNEYEQGDKPGDIYNETPGSIQDMQNVLLSHGWKEFKQGLWTRPGKSKGISGTIGKVAPNVFYVFSSNAYPFNENSAYTPFQVLALLDYNGDFKECAKYLADKLGLEKKSKEPIKKVEQKITIDEKKALILKSMIDTSKEVEKPPVILYISDSNGARVVMKRLFTLGNFSAIIGKVKSRKTFNLVMLTAAMVKNGNVYNKFYGNLPGNRMQVLYFDTEQGLFDSYKTIRRIEMIANIKSEFFGAFNIREYSPIERCEFIEYCLEIFGGVGFVVIDGIADLAKAINDEEEATRVTGLLLRWTKQYDCHICSVIHQNKNDNFATGHLGSSVMKKAEIVISTTKEKGSNSDTTVSCDYSRGIDFDDYNFFINDKELPEVSNREYTELPIDRYYD